MTKEKIIVAKFSYHDQWGGDTAIIGVFTDLEAAKACRDGYVKLYEVVPNSYPMELIPLKDV